MGEQTIVAAVGHTFPDLHIERDGLSPLNVEVVDGRQMPANAAAWRDVRGVLLGTAERLDRARLESMPRCKAVVRYGIGVDNVDVAAATELGIVVCNVRDYCIEEVADHVLACAMACSRRLVHWDKSVRDGAWRGRGGGTLRRLSACAFGIVGFGQIGRMLGRKAACIFGEVLVHDPWVDPSAAAPQAGLRFVSRLHDLLAQADIVSVHVPLTPETRGLLGEEALARMKKEAILINASRGGIVDEEALVRALENGRLGGAALDTFVQEPLPPGHPLIEAPGVLLSPHVAWLSQEAAAELRERATAEMARVLTGDPPVSPINP